MARRPSRIHAGWWDYTTLDDELLDDAAKLDVSAIAGLSRPGFRVRLFDDLAEFWVAEAMEYVNAWRRSTADNPCGICGPIGPTEQLPIVARIVNDLELDVRHGHFWGMDEWVIDGATVGIDHPLSFARADLELCFNRIDAKLRMPDSHLHFPSTEAMSDYSGSFDAARCLVMQGGQGEVKHWAFNDPPKREGPHAAEPDAAAYRTLGARVVELHPLTLVQNARTSFAGRVAGIPTHAATVGPEETFRAERISIWHPGWHDNPFGIRLTTLMLSKRIVDASVPMSLLADHPDVTFSIYRPGLGATGAEMH